jgi:parallel beta-helix repeat protein
MMRCVVWASLEDPMRRGLRAFVFVVTSLVAGPAVDAGAQAALAESLDLPRHGASRDLAPALTSASALALDPLCGSSVVGLLVLDRDVSCGTLPLELAAGATLDLGGFTYEGYIESGRRDVTLRNGTVAHGGIDFYACDDCRIEDVHVRDGDAEFTVGIGLRTVVRASRFSGNDVALDLFDWSGLPSGDNTIVDCEFEDNTYAVNIASYSGNLIESNTFRGNGVGVNLWDEDEFGVNDNTVAQNEFVENTVGVAQNVVSCQETEGRCQQGNRVTDNVFRRNEGSGMSVRDLGECGDSDAHCDAVEMAIEDNLFDTNGFAPPPPPSEFPAGDDGLSVTGPPELTDGIRVTRNVAISNADLGIEAPGALDGGGNRARDNGDPQQCVGVVCEWMIDLVVSPGHPRDRIDPRSHGLIRVAILGSQTFDVAELDARALAFGPAGALAERHPRPKRRDLSRDGFPDLLVSFRASGTGIAFGDREVCLVGRTRAGIPVAGCAAIVTAGPPRGQGHGDSHGARRAVPERAR